MTRPARVLFPRIQRQTEKLGQRLRSARLRRRIPLGEMAARVGVNRKTLARLEKGDTAVALALLVRALSVLGLEEDLDRLARDDELGARLADLRLAGRPRRTSTRRATNA